MISKGTRRYRDYQSKFFQNSRTVIPDSYGGTSAQHQDIALFDLVSHGGLKIIAFIGEDPSV